MNFAVLFAGGIGARMKQTSVPKQFLEIHGRPVIVHTIQHFQDHPDIDGIVVAILPEYQSLMRSLITRYELDKVKWVVDGGNTGQESRHHALKALSDIASPDSIVLIHDGVRPLINADLITENIASVRLHGSGVTCTKMTETVVKGVDDQIGEVIPRDELWTAQAPQSFRLAHALAVYDRAVDEGERDSIDTCSLMRRYGHDVHRVEGPRTNIKITTASDYYICRTFFTLIEDQRAFGDSDERYNAV